MAINYNKANDLVKELRERFENGNLEFEKARRNCVKIRFGTYTLFLEDRYHDVMLFKGTLIKWTNILCSTETPEVKELYTDMCHEIGLDDALVERCFYNPHKNIFLQKQKLAQHFSSDDK